MAPKWRLKVEKDGGKRYGHVASQVEKDTDMWRHRWKKKRTCGEKENADQGQVFSDDDMQNSDDEASKSQDSSDKGEGLPKSAPSGLTLNFHGKRVETLRAPGTGKGGLRNFIFHFKYLYLLLYIIFEDLLLWGCIPF